jgi:hypothetical protein
MELLLNLAWLLLALPAYWLWRRNTQKRDLGPWPCLLALACALIMLFPVVSATDDLHAMRAEMEESGASKRVRQAGTDRTSSWHSRGQNSPAAIAAFSVFAPGLEGWHDFSVVRLLLPAAPLVLRATRGPPCSLLA